MVDFLCVWRSRHQVLDAFDKLERDMLDNKELERFSVVKMQSFWRGTITKWRHTCLTNACINIQRVFRGHMGRVRTNDIYAEKKHVERMAFFHYQAAIIQKAFRGYYSRRYSHDFFARKAYIQSILQKSENLRNQLKQHRTQQIKEEELRRRELAQAEFHNVTQNLHHLVSTKATPGIYNTPYFQEEVPTAFGVPIEDHLRTGARDFVRSRKLKTTKIRKPTERDRLSVQASSEFDIVTNSRRQEERFNRMRQMSPTNFLGGGKAPAPAFSPGISNNTPFTEAWRLSLNSRDLEDKTLRVSSKPFHLAAASTGKLFRDYQHDKNMTKLKTMKLKSKRRT